MTSERLKVLVLSARLPRRGRDGSWVLHHLLVDLAGRHELTLFALAELGDSPSAGEELRDAGVRVLLGQRMDNSPARNLHHLQPAHLSHEYGEASTRRSALKALAEVPHDVLHVEYSEMASIVHRHVRSPSLFTCHESQSLACRRRIEGLPRWGLRSAWTWLEYGRNLLKERELSNAFGHVVALSSADAAVLRRLAPGTPVSVIPSGVDTQYFVPPSTREVEGSILFVGYFGHPPNEDAARWLALRIFPEVQRRLPGASLRIVGGEPSARLRALGHRPGIHVTGSVPDLREEYARAAAVVAPIRQGGGLRGKVLEAWASGKAVVASPRAAEGLAIRDGHDALVRPDAVGLAGALVDCLQDRALRARLGAAGRDRACAEFSRAGDPASKYEHIYEELLRASRPRR